MRKLFTSLVILFSMLSLTHSAELKDNPLVHYVGLNFGSTTIFNHYTSAHIGINYEFKKFEGRHGIGLNMDYMFGPETEFFIAFPISFHRAFGVDELVISAAPGIGITTTLNYLKYEEPSETEEDIFLPQTTRQNFLLRASVAWKFPIRNESNEEFMAISTYMNLDFIADYVTYLSLGTKINFYIY